MTSGLQPVVRMTGGARMPGPHNVYMNAETEQQLKELQERWGLSASAAIAKALREAE